MAHVQRATIGFPSWHAARALVLQTKMATSGHWIIFALVMLRVLRSTLPLPPRQELAGVLRRLSLSPRRGQKVGGLGEDPGLARFGTVWLPVPHLLLLPFSLASSLFSTGLAGAAVGVPSLALTASFLYKITRTHLAAPAYLAGAGALLYALNPNVLYLGLTAMTEGPFMLFFVASAYFLQKWCRQPDDLRSLMHSSIFVVLATLCRYEGWILPLFFVSVISLMAARSDLPARRKAAGIVLAVMSCAGVLLWVGYNAHQYGDPLRIQPMPSTTRPHHRRRAEISARPCSSSPRT